MAIKKRGKIYWIDTYSNGKRIRASLHTEQYYYALDRSREIERNLGRVQTGPAIALEDIASKYRAWADSSHPATARQEAGRLRWLLDNLKKDGIETLGQITTFHVESLRGRLKAAGRCKSTINRYTQILRGLFYRAIEWGDYRGDNPIRRVKFYREEQNLRPLTPAEMDKIISTARTLSGSPLQKIFPDLLEFAINTGMRKGEILSLKWADVRAGEAIIKGKGDKSRAVPLNRRAKEIISHQDRGLGEFIFNVPNRNRPEVFFRTTETIKRKTGIPFHFHLCRHFFATQLLARGADIVTISSILGHSKTYTTLLYSHASQARNREAVDLLCDPGPDTGNRD